MITSALPYANGPLHVGHIAGAYLPADIYVRYLKMKGEDVVFICGSDEHGAAITIRAKKDGVTPKEIIDKYHEMNKRSFEGLGIHFDHYDRTSSQLHRETAQEYFLDLYNKGVFEEKETEQFYDEEYDQFLADRYIIGTCPHCSNPNAYGDQCEKCGTSLSPTDLINPRSTLSDKEPVLRKTKHWYLPLNKYEDWLRSWIIDGEGRKENWKKNVAGQCRSWIEQGLQPRSITRDLDWGVPVPLPGAEGKVLYVWLDAPIGYISATKQWSLNTGKDWKSYWQDDKTKLVHFIGKDNIVFHCIIFPVILKASEKYILPTNVPANEFMNLEGDKISTSRNWAVWVDEYLKDFPGQEDVLRYYVCSNFPENKDSEFTWAEFQARNNNELVATLGNFVNRVLVLMQKYYDGVVPQPGTLEQVDLEFLDNIDKAFKATGESIEKYEFRAALNDMMELARSGDRYLAAQEPWKLIKTNATRTATILYCGLQVVANLSSLIAPFLPFTAKKLRGWLALDTTEPTWEPNKQLIASGTQLPKPGLLFSKIEDQQVTAQVDKLKSAEKVTNTETSKYMPVKPEITFDDFVKLDLRTGTVVEAQKIPKADKLLQLTVDLGFEQRTVVSGIAEFFAPEDLVGQQVSVVVNLAPRKMRGVESQGMILMAEDEAGKLGFVAPGSGFPNGMTIR